VNLATVIGRYVLVPNMSRRGPGVGARRREKMFEKLLAWIKPTDRERAEALGLARRAHDIEHLHTHAHADGIVHAHDHAHADHDHEHDHRAHEH
jgi:hypothetical protein